MRLTLRKLIFIALVFCSFPALADFGTTDGVLELESLSRLDENGHELFVALSINKSELREYSSGSTTPHSIVALTRDFEYLDIEPVTELGVVTGVAVLGRRISNNGVRVWLWSRDSKTLSKTISFGNRIVAKDLEVYEDSDGQPRISLLAYSPSLGRGQIIEKSFNNALPSQLYNIARGFVGEDLEQVDSTTSGHEWAVLGTVTSNGASRIHLISTLTGRSSGSAGLGLQSVHDFAVLTSADVGDPLFAILRAKTRERFIRVGVRERSGALHSVVSIRSDSEPKKLLLLSGLPNATAEIGVLTSHSVHHHTEFHALDLLTGIPLATPLNFGAGARSEDAIAFHIETTPTKIAVAQELTNPTLEQIKIRTIDGRRVRTLPLEARTNPPKWFTDNRVHGHTRLPIVHPRLALERSYYDTAISDFAASHLSELGASVFTRHAKSADEDPWWPSETPELPLVVSRYAVERNNEGITLGANANPIQNYINEAWANQIPMIAYYAESGEQRISEEHPEWICLMSNGTSASHATKGYFLDITSQYGQIVQTRLMELADMGASGIYLDFRHMPANGCWGTQLAADYTTMTGLSAPANLNASNYQQFVEYFSNRVVDTITQWQQALNLEYPQLQLVVSVTSLPALTRADMNTRLASISSPKSEFELALQRGQSNSVFTANPDLYQPRDDVRIALGWSLLRDVAGENLPHVWTALMPNKDHVLAFISAVTSHGVIAALDVVEDLVSPEGAVTGAATREDLKAGFALGERISHTLRQTENIRWAGIHFSEKARNSFERDSLKAWQQLLLPVVGAYETFSSKGVPIKIITDDMLENDALSDIEIIYIAGPQLLSGAQQTILTDFQISGGIVIENDSEAIWHTLEGYQTQRDQLALNLDSQHVTSPVSALLPEGIHINSYRSTKSDANKKIVVAITNKFDFVQSFTISTIPDSSEIKLTPPPIPAGIEVFLDHKLFSDSTYTDFTVKDAITDTMLTFQNESDGIRVTLPAIDKIGLVVVQGK